MSSYTGAHATPHGCSYHKTKPHGWRLLLLPYSAALSSWLLRASNCRFPILKDSMEEIATVFLSLLFLPFICSQMPWLHLDITHNNNLPFLETFCWKQHPSLKMIILRPLVTTQLDTKEQWRNFLLTYTGKRHKNQRTYCQCCSFFISCLPQSLKGTTVYSISLNDSKVRWQQIIAFWALSNRKRLI